MRQTWDLERLRPQSGISTDRCREMRQPVQFVTGLKRSLLGDYGLPLGFALGMAILLLLLFSHRFYDDPFVTYRYADNLRFGNGLVYNPGDRILSATSPLFASLLAGIGIVYADTPRAANVIGILSVVVGALALFGVGLEWESRVAAWTGLLLYSTSPLVLSTVSSETPLYLALILLAFVTYSRRRYSLTAACLALGLLTRPDGALVVALLGADFVRHTPRRIPWLACLVFASLTLPWIVFAWTYYGSPLPATLATKQLQGTMLTSEQFLPGLLMIVRESTDKPVFWLEGAVGLLGIVCLTQKNRHWIVFLLWPVSHVVAYSALGVSRYFWYYASLVPGLVAATGIGISALVHYMPENTLPYPGPNEWRNRIARIRLLGKGKLLAGLGVVALLLMFLSQGYQLWVQSQERDERVEIYRTIGQWIQANTPEASTVGVLETGIIGYYAHRRMIDFAGLIYPVVARQLTGQTDFDAAALWGVERYHPDYIVLQENTLTRFEEEYVWYHCWPLQYFSGQRYHFSGDISVYTCPSKS